MAICKKYLHSSFDKYKSVTIADTEFDKLYLYLSGNSRPIVEIFKSLKQDQATIYISGQKLILDPNELEDLRVALYCLSKDTQKVQPKLKQIE